MAVTFPGSPAENDSHSTGGRIFVYNGKGWRPQAMIGASDAQLRDRATHTGTQPLASVAGLQASLDGLQDTISGRMTGFRNRVINGDCRIMQRPLSPQTPIVASGFTYFADMWAAQSAGADATAYVSQSLAIAGFPRTALVLSGAAGVTQLDARTRIESMNIADLAGKQVTVSALVYHQGTSGQVKIGMLAQTPSATDTWSGSAADVVSQTAQVVPVTTVVQLTWTVTLPATATRGLELVLSAAGVGITAGQVIISEVQLEPGSVATDFERRPAGLDLQLCQRYLPSSMGNGVIGMGYSYQAGSSFIRVPFSCRSFRQVTGITVYTPGAFTLQNGSGVMGSSAVSSLAFNLGGVDGADLLVVTATNAPTISANQPARLHNSGSGRIIFTGAEL